MEGKGGDRFGWFGKKKKIGPATMSGSFERAVQMQLSLCVCVRIQAFKQSK